MKEIFEKVLDEKLKNGDIEKIVSKRVDECIDSVLSNMFSYSGEYKKAVEEKLNPIMAKALDSWDLNKMVDKITIALNEIASSCVVAKYLKNASVIQDLCSTDPLEEKKEVTLKEIFKVWVKDIEDSSIDHDDANDLDLIIDDGCVNIDAVCDVTDVDDEHYYRDSNEKLVKFYLANIDEDNDFYKDNYIEFKLIKSSYSNEWHVDYKFDKITISDLRRLSKIEMLLCKLYMNYTNITELNDSDDSICMPVEY